jgi:amidohydrolase
MVRDGSHHPLRAAAVALLLSTLLPLLAFARQDAGSNPLLSQAGQRLQREEARLIAFRRDPHRHPEVSGAEERTAGRVASRLRELALEVRTGVGGHGVVALIRGARSVGR